jgi:hypothetical protein
MGPHEELVQSAPVLQPLPSVHFVGHEPPQSTPVSVPFWVLSVQEGALQVPLQMPSTQSLAMLQLFPSAQGAHEPPQSMSVSSPSFCPSVHDAGGAAHTLLVHTSPFWQSSAPLHPAPRGHAVVSLPQLPPSTVAVMPASSPSGDESLEFPPEHPMKISAAVEAARSQYPASVFPITHG